MVFVATGDFRNTDQLAVFVEEGLLLGAVDLDHALALHVVAFPVGDIVVNGLMLPSLVGASIVPLQIQRGLRGAIRRAGSDGDSNRGSDEHQGRTKGRSAHDE